MESRNIENTEEKFSFESMVLDLVVENQLTAKGHLMVEFPSEMKIEFVDDLTDLTNEIKNKADLYKSTGGFMLKGGFTKMTDMFNYKVKVIEIVDEKNNAANLKVGNIIELSEELKAKTAEGLFFSKEDKVVATVEKNFGLLITDITKELESRG